LISPTSMVGTPSTTRYWTGVISTDKMLHPGGLAAFNDCAWSGALSLGWVRAPLDIRDRYFRKDADWEPRWDFVAPF